MTIPFLCEACRRRYEVPRRWIGRRVRCKACGNVQRVPAAPAPGDEPSGYELVPEPASSSEHRPDRESEAAPPERREAARLADRPRLALLEECRVQRPAVALLALSACDLFMTFTLLRRSPAYFESNPVAMWFFARWNMAGMALFKFGVIGLAILACEVVERKRPGLGKLVLILGCVAAAYALVQGYRLFLGVDGPSPPGGD